MPLPVSEMVSPPPSSSDKDKRLEKTFYAVCALLVISAMFISGAASAQTSRIVLSDGSKKLAFETTRSGSPALGRESKPETINRDLIPNSRARANESAPLSAAGARDDTAPITGPSRSGGFTPIPIEKRRKRLSDRAQCFLKHGDWVDIRNYDSAGRRASGTHQGCMPAAPKCGEEAFYCIHWMGKDGTCCAAGGVCDPGGNATTKKGVLPNGLWGCLGDS